MDDRRLCIPSYQRRRCRTRYREGIEYGYAGMRCSSMHAATTSGQIWIRRSGRWGGLDVWRKRLNRSFCGGMASFLVRLEWHMLGGQCGTASLLVDTDLSSHSEAVVVRLLSFARTISFPCCESPTKCRERRLVMMGLRFYWQLYRGKPSFCITE